MPDYPRRPQGKLEEEEEEGAAQLDLEEQVKMLEDLLPEADPAYLRERCELYHNNPMEMSQFVSFCIESKIYPTKKEALRYLFVVREPNMI